MFSMEDRSVDSSAFSHLAELADNFSNRHMNEIDQRSMTVHQWLIVALCFILNFNDGIDVLLVSFSSSDIITEFGLSKTEMGYVFSLGLAGMTLGAFLIAPQADVYGRRNIFLFAVGLIVIGMFGVGLVHSYASLLLFRGITGLGIGGILPTMAATASEFSNQKFKDFNVGLVQAGWPIGAILTGILSAKYIPVYGWHSAFILGGFVALVMWILVYFLMADSQEFLLNYRGHDTLAKINRLRKKMKLDVLDELPPIKNRETTTGIRVLFNPYYKGNTIIIWLAAFFGFLTLYTLMSWVPNIAKDAGMAFEQATYVGITLNIGAAIGSASIGALGSKIGMRQIMVLFLVLAFSFMQYYAFAELTFQMIFILVFLIGVFVQGGFNGIWPTLSRLYASGIRATGVGYTVGIGRLGAIIGPLLFGIFSDAGMSIQLLFVLFSLPLIGMAVCIWVLKSDRL